MRFTMYIYFIDREGDTPRNHQASAILFTLFIYDKCPSFSAAHQIAFSAEATPDGGR